MHHHHHVQSCYCGYLLVWLWAWLERRLETLLLADCSDSLPPTFCLGEPRSTEMSRGFQTGEPAQRRKKKQKWKWGQRTQKQIAYGNWVSNYQLKEKRVLSKEGATESRIHKEAEWNRGKRHHLDQQGVRKSHRWTEDDRARSESCINEDQIIEKWGFRKAPVRAEVLPARTEQKSISYALNWKQFWVPLLACVGVMVQTGKTYLTFASFRFFSHWGACMGASVHFQIFLSWVWVLRASLSQANRSRQEEHKNIRRED